MLPRSAITTPVRRARVCPGLLIYHIMTVMSTKILVLRSFHLFDLCSLSLALPYFLAILLTCLLVVSIPSRSPSVSSSFSP